MFYNNLKSLCDLKGLKITIVVTECGGALGSISKWRNGANPNSDIVIKLSLHLGVTTDYLLLGKETESSNNMNLINSNETTMMNLFRMLSEKEQDRIIGRLENMVEESQDFKNKDVV